MYECIRKWVAKLLLVAKWVVYSLFAACMSVSSMPSIITHDRAPIPRKVQVPDVTMSRALQCIDCRDPKFVRTIGAATLRRRLLVGRSDAVRRSKDMACCR